LRLRVVLGRTVLRERTSDAYQKSALLLAAAAIAATWLRPLASSLWLDETGTYWVIKGSFQRAIETGLRYHGQPLYYMFEWIWRALFGEREWILRTPSVLLMGLATLLLFRVASTLFDRFAAVLTVLAFLSIRDVVFAAADVRPYAAAMAFVLASTLAFLRLSRNPQPRAALLYCLTTAMAVHLHYFFGLIVVVHATYLFSFGRWRALSLRCRLILLVGLPALLIPAVPGFVDFAARRETLASQSTVQPIAVLLVPVLLAAVLLVVYTRPWIDKSVARPDALFLVSSWAIVPPLTLYVAAAVSGNNVFQARYALSAAPGLALMIGVILRAIPLRIAGFAIAATLLLTTSLTTTRSDHWGEDWQRAEAFIRTHSDRSQLLFVRAGFVESSDVEWLDDEERISYLTSPLSYYRVPGRIVALPFDASPSATPFLEMVAQRASLEGRGFLVITNYSHALDDWFRQRFEGSQYRASPRDDFGEVSVTVFRVRAG
jgi:hypothetical protein